MGDGGDCRDLKIEPEFLLEKPAPISISEREEHEHEHEFVFVKEASVEDVKSEVLNPIISPGRNANALSSFQDISSQLSECEGNNVNVVSGDIRWGCSGSLSSSGETVSEEEVDRRSGELDISLDDAVNDHGSGTDSTSRVVLQVPEHVSTGSGIRKITFKFSKRKEDYCAENPAPLCEHVNSVDCISWCDPNKDVNNASKDIVNYPTNVKKLLSIGILDGARVKYISHNSNKELHGFVNIAGYLCGCSSCNFSKVLSAYEFELHAGARTRHPNNHIYLENGKPIYSIIQELKTTPLDRLDEVIREVAGSSINEAFFDVWKANLQHKNRMLGSEVNYYKKLPYLPHSHVSHLSQGLEECFSFTESPFVSDYFCTQLTNIEIMTQQRALKRPSSSVSSSVPKQKKTVEGASRRRDNDLHRLLFMPNGLPDGAELAYYIKGQKILRGYKHGNGIVCNCCHEEISPSQFEAHAGMAARRQPYRHIYASNGLNLHDIATSLATGRSLTTDVKDDMCAKCGDAGTLIPCESCPRSFHLACLGMENMPEGVWNCPDCNQSVHGDKFSRPIVIRLNQDAKTPDCEAGGCVICRADDYTCRGFDDRTVIICEQCEKEFHIGCLRETGVCDLKKIPKEDWFCCDDCSRIHLELRKSVCRGVQAISDFELDIINRKFNATGSLVGGVAEVQWRILMGRSRERDDVLLLSRAAAIFREVFAPIVAATGRDLIPVMVYGRNIMGQEFAGMYCVILIVNSVVVSAGLLRIFGREVAELPLVATSREHQGKGYFQALFSCIERMLFSMNVEKLVLPAAEEAESIWTNRFRFRKMNEEQVATYMRQYRVTVFKGSSMLEKAVPWINN